MSGSDTAVVTNQASSTADLTGQRIVVLDFGSQYAQLIARRVREQNVYCQIVRHDIPAERLAEIAPKGNHPFWRPVQRLRRRCTALRSHAI